MKTRFYEKSDFYFKWTFGISMLIHLTLFTSIYVLTNITIKFKTLKPISESKVAVQIVEKKSTLDARPAQPKPITKPPQPKPQPKPKEVPKPVQQQPKPKPEIKNPQQKQIVSPKLSPVPTPEPQQVAAVKPQATEKPQVVPTPKIQAPPPTERKLPEEQKPPDVFELTHDSASIPDYYIANARLLIMSHFTVPSYLRNTDTQCRVSFSVSRQGEISNIKIDKTSGNGVLDMVALRAIQDTGSLAPLPDEIKNPFLNVIITFDFRYAE